MRWFDNHSVKVHWILCIYIKSSCHSNDVTMWFTVRKNAHFSILQTDFNRCYVNIFRNNKSLCGHISHCINCASQTINDLRYIQTKQAEEYKTRKNRQSLFLRRDNCKEGKVGVCILDSNYSARKPATSQEWNTTRRKCTLPLAAMSGGHGRLDMLTWKQRTCS